MPKVTIVNQKKDVEIPAGGNLRLELRKADVPVYAGINKYLNCRGLGLCGTCKVYVKEGMENVTPKTFIEKMNLNFHPHTAFAAIGHEDEVRLACQMKINGDCKLETTPEFNLSGENFWQKPYPNK